MFKKFFEKLRDYKISKINQKADEDEGIILPLSFSYGIKLQLVKIKRKFLAKKWQYSTVFTILIIFSVGIFWLQKDYIAKGATYYFVQSSWSGGADTNAIADHTNNQSNWTQYYSKDSTVEVDGSGHLTLSSGTSPLAENTDEDFNAGTKTDVYVSGGEIKLKKPDGASCSSADECFENACINNICGKWISNPCSGVEVYYQDISTQKQWKTSNTNCDTPQCGQDGAQDGDNLVADNNVDFSLYPARSACKDLGGRLPNRTELQCIYENKGSYNMSLVVYWSSTEATELSAYRFNMDSGVISTLGKNTDRYVRCVR